MSNLRSLSSRQKKFMQEVPTPMFNKTVQPIKQASKINNNITKEPEKSKITIADAIGLITIRLGKVEQSMIDLNMNENYSHSSQPVIDQNQNMNTSEHQLLLNTCFERLQHIETSTKTIDKLDSDLRDTKDLLIKLMAKQEKNLAEQELQNTNIHTLINDKINEILDTKIHELLNDCLDEFILNKLDELVSNKVHAFLKKTADEIISKNVDDIINIKYHEALAVSNNLTSEHDTSNVSETLDALSL